METEVRLATRACSLPQDSHKGIPADQRYKGMVDCFQRVNKEQGFFSFWRGNVANVVSFVPDAHNSEKAWLPPAQMTGEDLATFISSQDLGNVVCMSHFKSVV